MCGPSRVFQKTTIWRVDWNKTCDPQNHLILLPPKTPSKESFISGSSVLDLKKNADPPGPGFFVNGQWITPENLTNVP